MDYWIWRAIEVISPAIVVIEYNYRFGNEDAVTASCDPSFDCWKAHPLIVYYGALRRALCRFGTEKGDAFVGCGSAGLNAFFVRRDLKPAGIRELIPEEGFVEGQFCQAHTERGERIKMTKADEARLVHSLALVHLNGNRGSRG